MEHRIIKINITADKREPKKRKLNWVFLFLLARLIAGHKSGGQDGLTGFWPKCKTVFIIFVLDNVLKISQQV